MHSGFNPDRPLLWVGKENDWGSIKVPDALDGDFFAKDTLLVAQELLGKTLVYNGCEGIIVETEAYKDDAASHAVTRPKKGALLRDTYGAVYIYLIYGMYHCLNFTTEKNGVGAVLLRAIEPTKGIDAMTSRRQVENTRNLTSGPGKLFQAFGFRPEAHGEKVGESIRVINNSNPDHIEIICGPRIGISKATDLEWRFYIKGNLFVSHTASMKPNE